MGFSLTDNDKLNCKGDVIVMETSLISVTIVTTYSDMSADREPTRVSGAGPLCCLHMKHVL